MTDFSSPSEPTSALADDRLQFFLENRDLIRTWAALADEVSAAVDEELRRLAGQVQARAVELGLELSVASAVAGDTWQAPMLHHPNWAASAAGPDIAVGIGWDGSKVQPTRGWPGVSLPYVGLLASHDSERGRRIEEAVRRTLEAGGAKRSKPFVVGKTAYLVGSHWIAFRYIEAAPDWYTDVPAWRASVVEQIIQTWRDWAPEVDGTIASIDAT